MSSKWFGKKRVDSEDLANMLGDALDTAFERHLPSPQDIADSIAKAIDAASFSTAEQLGKVKAEFHEMQKELAEQWGGLAEQTRAHREVLETLPEALSAVNEKQAERMTAVFQGANDSLAEMTGQLKEVHQQHGLQMGTTFQEMTRAFAGQVSEIKATAEKLTERLAEIRELGEQIDRVLQIQNTVEGTVRQVVATEEMRELFSAMRTQLERNGEFLVEASKPRTIRLVETERVELPEPEGDSAEADGWVQEAGAAEEPVRPGDEVVSMAEEDDSGGEADETVGPDEEQADGTDGVKQDVELL